ncbi:MAG: sugar kinase [Pseudomonadales bacterium]
MKRVVCIGECMVECFEDTSGDALLSFAGDTFNTAVYMARETDSLEIHFLTAVGQDETSEAMLQAMRLERLHIDRILKRPDRTVGRYTIFTDEQGERSFTYEREQSAARTVFDSPGSAEDLLNRVDPDLIYLTGISLAILPKAAREQLLNALKARGSTVAFDPNYRPLLWKDRFEALHWIQSFAEISSFLLTSVEDDRQLLGLESSEQSRAYWGGVTGGELVIKNGSHPVMVVPQTDKKLAHPISIPVIAETQPVDTTGAGDAFNGVYLIKRIMGADPTESATASVKLCSNVVMCRGAILPR